MLLSSKLKAQLKTLLIKEIKAKKTGIVKMTEKAYDYAEERLPKWFTFLFGNLILRKIDELFMEALKVVKYN